MLRLIAIILHAIIAIFLISRPVISMHDNRATLDYLRNREIEKTEMLIKRCNENLSPNASQNLHQLIDDVYQNLQNKFGDKIFLLTTATELKKSFLKKLVDKYFFFERISSEDEEKIQECNVSFFAHLEEALSDSHDNSALARDLLSFRNTVDEIFLNFASLFRAYDQRNLCYGLKAPPSDGAISHEHSQGKCDICRRDIATEWFGTHLLCRRCSKSAK